MHVRKYQTLTGYDDAAKRGLWPGCSYLSPHCDVAPAARVLLHASVTARQRLEDVESIRSREAPKELDAAAAVALLWICMFSHQKFRIIRVKASHRESDKLSRGQIVIQKQIRPSS
jgi:hypothetical protein